MQTINTVNTRRNILTAQHRVLNKHDYTMKGGIKTVCVSACLSFFGISPDKYYYTSGKGNTNSYDNVLRRFGYSVASRATEFKLKKYNSTTMTELKRNMKKSKYTADDHFIVSGVQSKSAHLMVLNGNGETLIDTAAGSKWRIRSVKIVK